jgi:hypothetical protein
MATQTIFRLDSKMTFGQYKGWTIEDILKKDPEYLGWAEDTIDWFELDNEAEGMLDEAVYGGIDWDE